MKHEATVRWAGRMTFIGKAGSNHLVPMDSGPEFGGDSSATKPMELLLLSLGSCTGMDVVPILKKMRQDVTAVELNGDTLDPAVYALETNAYGRTIITFDPIEVAPDGKSSRR